MRGKSPSHLRRAALGLACSLLHGAPPFLACGGMIARASSQVTFQTMLIGVHVQHALELAHHVDIELVDDFLLRWRLDWRHVGDDAGHFLWHAAPAEVLEEFGCSHDRLESGRAIEKATSRVASVFTPTAIVRGERQIQGEQRRRWGRVLSRVPAIGTALCGGPEKFYLNLKSSSYQ